MSVLIQLFGIDWTKIFWGVYFGAFVLFSGVGWLLRAWQLYDRNGGWTIFMLAAPCGFLYDIIVRPIQGLTMAVQAGTNHLPGLQELRRRLAQMADDFQAPQEEPHQPDAEDRVYPNLQPQIPPNAPPMEVEAPPILQPPVANIRIEDIRALHRNVNHE